jgi:hypothetical protein
MASFAVLGGNALSKQFTAIYKGSKAIRLSSYGDSTIIGYRAIASPRQNLPNA